MKKTAAALALAIAVSPAFGKTATLDCAFAPETNNHSFKLTFNDQTKEATLQGKFQAGTPGYSYTLKPSANKSSDYTLSIKEPKGSGMSLQVITDLNIESKFKLPDDKKVLTIKLAGTNSRLICPVPTRAYGLD